MTSCALASSKIDIRQLPRSYNTHQLSREECHFNSMQIPPSHDPVWIVVGAVQHGRSCFTGLAWMPSAIQKKRISSLESLQAKKKERKKESDKQCSKGRIAFWCSLYSASFKEQDVNRTDATSNMTCISYWCRNWDFYCSLWALGTQAWSLAVIACKCWYS